MVDLHTHSTASDGTLSPSELIRFAKREGIKALALTDHDTTSGLREAYETAEAEGLSFLCGVEISVKFSGPGHFHLLGYFLTPDIPELSETLLRLQEARKKRNEEMVKKLKGLGIDIELSELEELAQGEIGRPHFARLLVEKGYVRTPEEAFEKYLRKGAPAYVPKALLTPEEAIENILRAGGVPVLAHPVTLKLSQRELSRYFEELKDLGLKGIEVYYSEHNREFTNFLLSEVRRLGLIATGGSDFHGENKPDIKLGRGFGNLKVPEECYEKLKNELSKLY